jgi:hypothetical protein
MDVSVTMTGFIGKRVDVSSTETDAKGWKKWSTGEFMMTQTDIDDYGNTNEGFGGGVGFYTAGGAGKQVLLDNIVLSSNIFTLYIPFA